MKDQKMINITNMKANIAKLATKHKKLNKIASSTKKKKKH